MRAAASKINFIDPADRFLRHLLLEERADAALEHDPAVGRFHANLAARHVRIADERFVNLLEQRAGGGGGAHGRSEARSVGGREVGWRGGVSKK